MARQFRLLERHQLITEKCGKFCPLSMIYILILDQDEAQVLSAPLDKLLFKDDIQRVGKIQFRAVPLGAHSLLAFENEFDVGRRYEGQGVQRNTS